MTVIRHRQTAKFNIIKLLILSVKLDFCKTINPSSSDYLKPVWCLETIQSQSANTFKNAYEKHVLQSSFMPDGSSKTATRSERSSSSNHTKVYGKQHTCQSPGGMLRRGVTPCRLLETLMYWKVVIVCMVNSHSDPTYTHTPLEMHNTWYCIRAMNSLPAQIAKSHNKSWFKKQVKRHLIALRL